MNGHDPLFLSIALLELVIKSASETDLESYLGFAENLSKKNLTIDNLNTNLADETFVIQEQILKCLKKDDEIRIATEVYADYYESLAEKSTQEGENLRNLNAHGVLEPEKGNGSSALYSLCLLIRLLSMYSPNAFTIVKKLAEKDSCAGTE